MKLQKQSSRKVGDVDYAKWVVVLPPKEIEEIGWEEGQDLETVVKNNKIVLRPKRSTKRSD